jgi:sigma-B regulation protein RsbU (phosphoserine phosphatase)
VGHENQPPKKSEVLKSASHDELVGRIHELETEVAAREKDLAVFRSQLAQANKTLEGLISRVAEEVKTAALIQKVLVPTEFPNIPGFEFSTKFVPSPISGGDYFDIFEHEDRLKFGVVLASSNGYGMSALLLSVLLKVTGQNEAKRGLSPEKLLQAIASELEPSFGSGPKGQDRANVFYATIDRRNLQMNYSTAGLLFGAVLRSGDKAIERLKSADGAIEKGWHLTEGTLHTLSLEARDRVILVSGGAIAAKNPKGETFGEDRLIRAITAHSANTGAASIHDARNEILYSVEKHANGQDLPQDVTVVVFEVKDRVIRLAPRR